MSLGREHGFRLGRKRAPFLVVQTTSATEEVRGVLPKPANDHSLSLIHRQNGNMGPLRSALGLVGYERVHLNQYLQVLAIFRYWTLDFNRLLRRMQQLWSGNFTRSESFFVGGVG